MRLVADANVLFALSKPSSAANSILSTHRLKLLSPDFALVELYSYRKELVRKSGEKRFETVIESLKSKVVFVDASEYKEKIRDASSKISDPKDIAYLALALKLGVPVWSNDRHFKEQTLVDAFTTEELIKLLGRLREYTAVTTSDVFRLIKSA